MTPRRCVRLGCSRDQAGGTLEGCYGLHLCRHHYNQFQAGTLGQDFDPLSKEWDAEEIALLIIGYAIDHGLERAGLRTIAQHLNTSKDSVHHILEGKYPVVRSRAACLLYTSDAADEATIV